jgi:hypothetical protein
VVPSSLDYPLKMNILEKYFKVTDDPETADFALVFVNGPDEVWVMIWRTGKMAGMVMFQYHCSMGLTRLSMPGKKYNCRRPCGGSADYQPVL